LARGYTGAKTIERAPLNRATDNRASPAMKQSLGQLFGRYNTRASQPLDWSGFAGCDAAITGCGLEPCNPVRPPMLAADAAFRAVRRGGRFDPLSIRTRDLNIAGQAV